MTTHIQDYYLDMEKVFRLDIDNRQTIIDFYMRIVDNPLDTESLLNTLLKAGYLKNKVQEERSEKIELING